ncbi:hypothetical protein BHE74_00034409 [Ensete ventricosum]|nr:hypothetical protein BHE74_00034409 [Ensete ventricosum]
MGVVGPLVDRHDALHWSRGSQGTLFPSKNSTLLPLSCNEKNMSRGLMSSFFCLQLWRKICMETFVELQLFMEKWKLLLAGLIFQELGKERGYVSESLFTFIFLSFILWTFHPFVYHSKRFYTVLLWRRILSFLVVNILYSQLNCIIVIVGVYLFIYFFFLLSVPHGVIYGCGDLIFSSHMIFTLVFVLTYHKYGTKRYTFGICATLVAYDFKVDPIWTRQRLQVNGKHGEDGNHIHSESAANGA